MRRNQEPGTATMRIASSACLLPARRHGMHASMSRLLIKNMSLAGSWLCKVNVQTKLSKAYSCTVHGFPAEESILRHGISVRGNALRRQPNDLYIYIYVYIILNLHDVSRVKLDRNLIFTSIKLESEITFYEIFETRNSRNIFSLLFL